MPLFDEFARGESIAPRAPGIETPLGELSLSVNAVGEPFLVVPDQLYALGPHGRSFVFRRDSIEAELIVSPFEALYPDDQELTDSWAAIWRVQALTDVPALSFDCSWAPNAIDSKCQGPHGGEYLDAESWIGTAPDGDWRVMVGTEGGDALANRARRGDWLPRRLGRNETWPSWTNVHRSDGFVEWLQLAVCHERYMRVGLPPLRPGERFQCHFLVAWAPSIEDEIATWFAVERLPHELFPALRF